MPPDDLGPVLSEHPGTLRAGGWLWYVGGVLLLAAVFNAFNGAKELAAGAATVTEVLSLVFFSALFGGLLLIVPVLRWRQKVVVHQNGIVWQRLLGERRIARGEVRGVQVISHRSRYGSHDEVLLLTADREVSISGVAHATQLANHARAWLASRDQPAPSGGGWTPPQQPSQPWGGGWAPPGS